MNTLKLSFILILMACSNFVLAERTSENPLDSDAPTVESEDEDEGYDPLQEKLLELAEVQDIKKTCEADSQNSGKPIKLGECIWGKVKNSPEILKKVESVMARENQDERKNKKEFEGLQITTLEDRPERQDPVVKKLEDYMVEKIEKAFYGEGETKNIVGHDNFYRIYQTQVGKNLIAHISSFCLDSNFMEAVSSTQFIIKEKPNDRRDQRKKNMDALHGSSSDSNYNKPLFSKNKNDKDTIQSKWNNCAANIQQICDGQVIRDDFNKSKQENSNEYTRQRACLVTQYAQETRQNLQLTDSIMKQFDKLAKNSGDRPHFGRGKRYDPKGENSLNSLTSLSAKELVEDSGVDDEAKAELERFKNDCFNFETDNDGKYIDGSGQGKNAERCKDYVGLNRKQLEEKLVELKLRAEAQKQKLGNTEDEFSDEKVIVYLKEQGYTDEKAQELLKVDKGKYIREIITNRYDKEKEEALKAIQAQIQNTTAEGEKINFGSSQDIKTLENVGMRLSQNAEDFKQLIKFNNIVSSFLELKSEDGSTTRNISGLQRELSNPGTDDTETAQVLQQRIDESGVMDGAGDADEGGAELRVDDLNTFFQKYEKPKDQE